MCVISHKTNNTTLFKKNFFGTCMKHFVTFFDISVGGVLTEAVQKRSDRYIAIGTYGHHPQKGLVCFNMETAARLAFFGYCNASIDFRNFTLMPI